MIAEECILRFFLKYSNSLNYVTLFQKFCFLFVQNKIRVSLLAQDVIWMSIQRFLNVMNVRWTLKQRCVLTGMFSCLNCRP